MAEIEILILQIRPGVGLTENLRCLGSVQVALFQNGKSDGKKSWKIWLSFFGSHLKYTGSHFRSHTFQVHLFFYCSKVFLRSDPCEEKKS